MLPGLPGRPDFRLDDRLKGDLPDLLLVPAPDADRRSGGLHEGAVAAESLPLLAVDDLHPSADVPRVLAEKTERPVDAGRGDDQVVAPGDELRGVELLGEA